MDETGTKKQILEFFASLFSKDDQISSGMNIGSDFPKVEEAKWREMNEPFTMEEVKNAVFGMNAFKAPGPDGFHAGFFQKQWHNIGDSVTRLVLDFLSTGNMEHGLSYLSYR